MPFPSVSPALARALAAREYLDPTPVQAAVLQPETAGRDLVVSAQTGSGKTVAYGLAFAPTVLGDDDVFPARSGAPLALIIAPTRELAMQVHAELSWLYAEAGAKIVSCVGGMDARGERRLRMPYQLNPECTSPCRCATRFPRLLVKTKKCFSLCAGPQSFAGQESLP